MQKLKLTGLVDLGKYSPVGGVYMKGIWPKVVRNKVAAVIGSRKMTTYGERMVSLLVSELVSKGYVILSGLMYGVDKAAHRACLDYKGVTVAVLGWGINEPMSKGDAELAGQILSGGGAIVSEWEKQEGTRWTFPRRDRIIAALAGEIYVVEAAERSGSMITVEWGIKLKRKIWAIPGPVSSPVSVGTNALIKSQKAESWSPKGS